MNMDSLQCNFDTAFLLIFSDNVFSSLIYYSHLGPLAASLLLGGLVLLSNWKSTSNRLFFALTALFSTWVYFDLILWASEKPDLIMFFWSALVYVELLIYATGLYLVTYLVRDGKDLSLMQKLLLFIPFVPLFLFAHTSHNLLGYDASNCDRAAVEGPLWQYVYVVEALFILIASYILLRSATSRGRAKASSSSLFIGLAIVIFLSIFSLGNITILLSLEWQYEQYKLFGMPVLLAFVTYTMVKYGAFSSKMLLSQALVGGSAIMILSLLFVDSILDVRVIASTTFALVVLMGISLVKNVKREISQREKIEKLAKDLEAANDRLQELDRQKTEFVSIASHQLRAPITAIKGYASLLTEGSYGPIPEKMTSPIATIYESSRMMVNTIEDFLNVSRIELGHMQYAREDFNLMDLTRKVVDELTPNAKFKGLELSFNPSEVDAPVYADMNKIKQVITNFVDNAIKYTPKGSITVSLTTNKVSNKAIISIKDTGQGLSKETIGTLFDKFTRARNADKVNTTGTGLGLYVGRQLITGHNGRVWVESEGEGKGSTFFIELPLK